MLVLLDDGTVSRNFKRCKTHIQRTWLRVSTPLNKGEAYRNMEGKSAVMAGVLWIFRVGIDYMR